MLGIQAAQAALNGARCRPEDVSLVISAPSLLAAQGLEIPAVRLRAELGLKSAECLNIAQGCVGVLAAAKLAQQRFEVDRSAKNVLVVTTCVASTLTDHYTHGSFFWGDGAAAMVLTSEPGEGLAFAGYAECSADLDTDAMSIPNVGDAPRASEVGGAPRIQVAFTDSAAQTRYIRGERTRFSRVLEALASGARTSVDQFEAIFVPSTGANRVATLFAGSPELESRIGTDFSHPHIGGVDVFLFLSRYLQRKRPKAGSLFATLSPAFTAQWAGVLWQAVGEPARTS